MESDIITVFRRKEVKYLLTDAQMETMIREISSCFAETGYGRSLVSSVYYDNDEFELINRSIEKPRYKEKLRVRTYEHPVMQESQVFAEIKKKYNGTVYKRRVSGKYSEIKLMLESRDLGYVPPGADPQIAHELQWMMQRYDLKPKIWIGCERMPYESLENSSLRITFDSDLRYRTEDPDLCCDDPGEYIIPPDMHIMEIKSSAGLPLWLCRVLNENRVYPHGFSKVGTAFENRIFQTLIQE